jgi:hypothetical protein
MPSENEPEHEPKFFTICPYCKTLELKMNSYGAEAVTCACGVSISVRLNSWDSLKVAATRWNSFLAGLQNDEVKL